MALTPGLRRLALTVHIVCSVGWIGAVAGFLVLALAGCVSRDVELVRASYIAMDLIYRSAVVPLGLGSLASGIILSLGTDWGLIRHYWVATKLLLTVPTTLLMLAHVQQVGRMAGVAWASILSSVDLAGQRMQLVTMAIAALAVLLMATALSTYKPRGRTLYGAGKLREQGMASAETPASAPGGGASSGFGIVFAVFVVAAVALTIAHLTDHLGSPMRHLTGLHEH
jgi:hypothetical protein